MSRRKKPNLLRDQAEPEVLGYKLDRKELVPVRTAIDVASPGDHGCDPLGDGLFRMVPSGEVVDAYERDKRLAMRKNK